MNKLGTTVTTIALGGALVFGTGVTSAAAQTLPAVSAASAASPMLSAAVSPAAAPSAAGSAYRAAFLRSLPTLSSGSSGGEVLALQIGLNAAETQPQLQGTGYFGPVTRKAVMAFQRSHGLVADGVVGPRTWNALVDQHVDRRAAVATPQLRPGQLWSHALAPEERGAVTLVLHDLQGYTGWAPSVDMDGDNYDGAQVAVVKGIQQRAGITPSGILGARTARVLTIIIAMIEQYGD